MLPYFWYLLKVIICSAILFGYYWVFLRNKIFHQYNRFYLLASMGLSLLLPLLKINFWQGPQQNQAVRVLRAVSVGDEYMNDVVISTKTHWSFEQFYPMVYWLVCLAFLFVLLRTLFIIRTLLKQYPMQQVEDVHFVNTTDDSTPFSFLKYIFWNNNIDINTTTGRQIFKHEVAHIQQKHTYDKLFMNITLIFCWCNPFFWLYRKELNMIHEFIADKKAVEDSDTASFAAMILQAAYPKQRFELTNNFFYSPIKRRLRMLTKIDNPRVSYFVRLMVLPLAVLVFAAFTFKAKHNASIYHGKKITVVIDAGHGGQDLGATGVDGSFEKDFTLAIAKKVKELNSNSDIEIVLTRDEDIYMSPRQKADYAKSKNADLLISFHVDGEPASKVTKRSGMSFWVAKDEFTNSATSKVLASAIINEFSNNYGIPVMPEINQRQNGVWILQANTCPSILIETGFISTEKDVAYLKTEQAKETIAKNVLMGIEKYLINKPVTQNTSLKNTDTLPQKTATPISINGKKVKNVSVVKEGVLLVEYEDGTSYKMMEADAIKAGIKVSATGSAVPNRVSPYELNEPLYVVNGKETDKLIALDIKPEEIDTVRIIKIDLAKRVYGDKGKNGVVIINMKPGFGLSKNINIESSSGNVTIYDSTGKNPVGANPLIVIDNKEYIGKTMNDVGTLTDHTKIKDFTLYSAEKAIKIYGESAKEGAIIITTREAQNEIINKNSSDINSVTETPKIYLGNSGGGIIYLSYLKSLKELNVSQSYTFVSADIYFSGKGFDKVVKQYTAKTTSLSAMQPWINSCIKGSSITFDNVYVKDKNGNKIEVKNPPGFTIY